MPRRRRSRRHHQDQLLTPPNGRVAIQADHAPPEISLKEANKMLSEQMPNHATARPLQQKAVLGMQQHYGNAYVGRLLARRSQLVQRREGIDPIGQEATRPEREPEETTAETAPTTTAPVPTAPAAQSDPAAPTVGNPLVGLTRGDGLNVGTFERRPRVKLLQQKLNEKMLAGLNADGMFGPKTGQVLKEFQLSIRTNPQETVDPDTADALMDVKKNEKPPDELPASQELEDLMDSIWLQYQIMLKNQNDALNRLEKDLQEQEKPTNLVAELLKTAGVKALDLILFGQSDTLRAFIKEAISAAEDLTQDEKDTITGSGVDPLFDAAKTPAEDKLKSVVDDLMAVETPPLDTFIESQRAAITEASDAAQNTFLLETKPALRKPAGSKPEPVPIGETPAGDRRLVRARKFKKAVSDQKTGAFDKQYNESLSKWATTQAQSKVGTTPGKLFPEQTGTDMSKGEEGVPGVLELKVDGNKPNQPVKIEGAKIVGMSKVVRNRLKNKTVGEADLPVLAKGKVNEGFLGIKLFNASIKIAQNELDDTFEAGSSDGGKQWLQEKAAIDLGKLPPDLPVKPSPEEGANVVFRDDINKKKIGDIPDGLQGP
jgi:hypothetical protein